MEVLQKCLLMKRRLGLNQLLIYPLKYWILAKGKRVVQWFFDGKICVPAS